MALLITRIPRPQLLAGGLTIQIAFGSASTALSHARLTHTTMIFFQQLRAAYVLG